MPHPLQTLWYRLVSWRRNLRRPYDPWEMDPRVRFEGSDLGFLYDYHPKHAWTHRNTDEQGFSVVLFDHRWHRQPLTHCQITLAHFNRYLETGCSEERDLFIRGAELLLEEKKIHTAGQVKSAVWQFTNPVRGYAPHPVPWISAMAQGWSMSVLCRAYQATGRAEFLEAAVEAMGIYRVPVEQGGVRDTDEVGHVYYEEYAFPGKTHHVLNGFIHSLWGLWDLYRLTGNLQARDLFNEAIVTLTSPGVLDRYDMGYCSAYDQCHGRVVTPAYIRYNLVHVRQLIALYHITGHEILKERSEKWFGYSRDVKCRIRCLVDCLFYRIRNVRRYFAQYVLGR